MPNAPTIFWHRRDLRITDNAGLYRALNVGGPVIPIFIFDYEILTHLPSEDARVVFIHDSVTALAEAYRTHGGDLHVFYGKPLKVWEEIIKEYQPAAVYTNRDYEPYAKVRDQAVKDLLAKDGIGFHDYKDHIIFESHEVQKNTGGPYTVYTPFWRKWKTMMESRMVPFEGGEISYYLKPYPTEEYLGNLHQGKAKHSIPTLAEMGFKEIAPDIPSKEVPRKIKARKALGLNETYLKELVWRDFYSNILQAFPKVVNGPFRDEYKAIPWENDENQFKAWCAGKTGVPIVDAGMRQLNESGWMHNRVRMIVASYLTKHLLIDCAGAKHTSPKNCSTTTWPATTAAGSGRLVAVPMPSPISGSSTTTASRRNSTRSINTSRSGYQSTVRRSTHPNHWWSINGGGNAHCGCTRLR